MYAVTNKTPDGNLATIVKWSICHGVIPQEHMSLTDKWKKN